MIEQLALQNFQVHRKLSVDFAERVTTIIGETDTGKSTILRALRWVCLNRFDGPADSFINWDAESARVRLFIDGKCIAREKALKNKENLYQLEDDEYRAFGAAGVPPKIAQLINVSEVNFQQQIDQPFWFTLPAAQLSRELNQIVDLGVIDDTLSAIATTVRKSRSTLDVCESRQAQAREQRAQLADVIQLDADLTSLEHSEAYLTDSASRIGALRELVSRVSDVQESHFRAVRTTSEGGKVEELGCELLSVQIQVNLLSHLVSEASRAEQLSKTKVPTIEKLKQQLANARDTADRAERLRQLLAGVRTQQTAQLGINWELKQAEQQYKRETRNEVCPVCQSPL